MTVPAQSGTAFPFEADNAKRLLAAVVAAVFLHASMLCAVLFADEQAQPEFKILGVMDFSPYDPLGGDSGGTPEESPGPAPAVQDQLSPEEPTPDEVPEPEQAVVTTTAKSAVEEVAPPPKPQKKESPKPKPKPKPQAPKQTQPSGPSGQQPSQPAASGPGKAGPGGSGGGAGQGNPDAFNAYTAQIRKRIERYKKYPNAARAKKMEGVATVSFILDKGGNVLTSSLVKSSGHAILDEEAMALLKRAGPFPGMPKELTQSTIKLTLPLRFDVRSR